MSFKREVKYVGGSSITLAYPLSTGQDEFSADVVYIIESPADFRRLVRGGDFADVTPKLVKNPTPIVPKPETKPEVETAPKKESK